jgi:protein-S-isoprenylcysteine O-methyltransferase Ste14
MPDDTTAGTHGPARSRRPRRARKLQRAVHLVAALPVLAYIYVTPTADAPMTTIVRAGVVPVLVLSGLLLWQAPRLRRLRARRGRAVAV